jgi:hypothetical protein
MKRFNEKFGLLGWLLLISLVAMGAKISDNILRVGALTGADVEIQMGDGRLKWDNTASKMVFSNDGGSSEKEIGSGGGAGGGENFNNAFSSDDNANAEDGLTGWSETGGGTLALETTDPLEGEQSFNYTASAQNDYVEGSLLNVDKDIFKGRACQAQIEYIGGDENLNLQVVDAGGSVYAEATLKTHGVSAAENVFFLCPSATDISGDADLGQLRIRINNSGASAAPIVTFDKSYLGTLLGLSEVTSVDVFSARFDDAGTLISTSNSDYFSGNCSKGGTGIYDCPIGGGLTVAPACTVAPEDGAATSRAVSQVQETTTNVRAVMIVSTSGSGEDMALKIVCQKQGADARQSVQVYKSIPKVSEQTNIFTMSVVNSTDVVSNENVNWIDGNCTGGGAGSSACTFVAGTFSVAPNCTCTSAGRNNMCGINSISTSGFTVENTRHDNTDIDDTLTVVCQRTGADVKTETVQPILVNQVDSVVKSGESVFKCFVDVTAGVPSLLSDSCSLWIDSVTDNGVGDYSLNITSGAISDAFPSCFVATVASTQQMTTTLQAQPTNSLLRVKIYDSPSGSASDKPFNVFCIGDR